jgi:NAD(P)-dependent dehydrogenase (short-subunit alcohol dehydrogenase family)
MALSLEGRVAVVTGAGKGLGEAIAQKLFNEGATLALWDFDFESVKKVGAALDSTGKRAAAFLADVTDEASLQKAVADTVAKFQKIDILVNNAGISIHKPLEEMTMEIWQNVINVNLTGVFLCCKSVAPVMKQQKYGKIINIASLGGRTARKVGVNYAATKAGVIGITMCLARELGPFGIYVNDVCPGPILTEQTKQYPAEVFASWNEGRLIVKDGMPEDVGDAVVFLASGKSDWITGVSLDVNGGIMVK